MMTVRQVFGLVWKRKVLLQLRRAVVRQVLLVRGPSPARLFVCIRMRHGIFGGVQSSTGEVRVVRGCGECFAIVRIGLFSVYARKPLVFGLPGGFSRWRSSPRRGRFVCMRLGGVGGGLLVGWYAGRRL